MTRSRPLLGWHTGRGRAPSRCLAGVGAFLGNVIWVVLAGRWLATAHVISGIALRITIIGITIIGIPMSIADFKMVPISLMPLGKEIVSTRRGPFDAKR